MRGLIRGGVDAKRLIAFGSFPTPAYLAAHSATFDTYPYDGCVFQVPIGASYLQYKSWANETLSYSDFSASITDMQTANLQNMRYHLPILNARPEHGASTPMDWTNETWKTNIVNIFALTARFCAALNLPGFLFDAEPYNGQVWDWKNGSLTGATAGNSATFFSYAFELGRRCASAVRSESVNVHLFTCQTAHSVDENNNLYLHTAFLMGFAAAFGAGGKNIHLGDENTYTEEGGGTVLSYYAAASYETLYTAESPNLDTVAAHGSKFMAISASGGGEDWDHENFSNNFHTPATLESAMNHQLALNGPWSWMYFRGSDAFLTQDTGANGVIDDEYLDAIRIARAANGMRVW